MRCKGVDVRPKHPAPIRYVTPFSDKIMAAPFPQNFTMPNLVVYNGKGDPKAHVVMFNTWMNFEGVFEIARCTTFPLTLMGTAQDWHAKLQPQSIMSFEQQAGLFISQFMGAKLARKPVTHLTSIKQGVDEPLSEYARRFNKEAFMVEDYTK